MKKHIHNLFRALLPFTFVFPAYAAVPTFSPQQGEETFQYIFDSIAKANNYVYITVYSWSNSHLDKAIETALKNHVDVRVILHPPLSRKDSIIKKVQKLEIQGAHFKVSPINMHEKFVLIDGHFLVNTSANMSISAKTTYSENFVFFDKNLSNAELSLIQDFSREFSILWNISRDMITHSEGLAPAIDGVPSINEPRKIRNDKASSSAVLYSSSMNFTLKENKSTSKLFQQGRLLKLVRKGGKKNQTWTVRDKMIQAIKSAKKSIHLSLNHFNIRAISDALIEVVKENNIKVFLTVDNQEYKSYPNNKEMTPQFVQDWKKNFSSPPPVRVKYYSHIPSYRFWRLNHHKYMLVDYATPHVKLFTGSYNLSRTAEHNQFDNMVVFKGPEFENLYQAFYDEFLNLWNLNRTKNDSPRKDVLSLFTTKNRGAYPLHLKKSISLTFSEIKKLRRKVVKSAPGIFRALNKHRHCSGYNPKQKRYVGCPPQ